MPTSFLGNMLQFGAALYGHQMQQEENEAQRQWASRENEISRNENYRLNELAAVNADLRQRAQYHDLYSPSAQLAEIKKAGLSPALMYGGTPSAGGVATGQQGGGANGIGPSMPPIFSATQAAISAANMVANTQLMQAQAKKANEEANTIAGTNERGAAEIAKLYADKGYTDEAANILKLESELKKIDLFINNNTKEIKIDEAYQMYNNACALAEKNYFAAKREKLAFQIDDATYQTSINQRIQTLQKTIEETKLLKAQTETEKEKARQVYNSILIDWKLSDIKEANQAAQQKWFEEQIRLREEELGLNQEDLNIEKKRLLWDTIMRGLQTAAYTSAVFMTKGAAGVGTTLNSQPSEPKIYSMPHMNKKQRDEFSIHTWDAKHTQRPLWDN